MKTTDDAAVGEVLSDGSLEVHGRIADSSNVTLLVTAQLHGVDVLAIFKPERGERELWDFPVGLWRREVACFELDRLLGSDCVPVTVARDDPDFGPGSIQRWVHEDGVEHYLTLRDRPELVAWFERLAALDVVANNTDRKSGHVLLESDRCWAIDNGLCFHVDDKLRTVIWDFAGEPIDDQTRDGLARVVHGDVDVLRGLLAPDELAATIRRATQLFDDGVLPEPRDQGRYPPYPWPIV